MKIKADWNVGAPNEIEWYRYETCDEVNDNLKMCMPTSLIESGEGFIYLATIA